MKRTEKARRFSCDFETTVFEGQEYTEVWAAAAVELGTEDVRIFHSLPEWLDWMLRQGTSVIAYFHNLKFDGSFILSYLLEQGWKHASEGILEDGSFRFVEDKEMPSRSMKYTVSADMGNWYSITLKKGRTLLEIRDSLKLLPFSVKRIGDSFGTAHRKLDMEYKGFRYAGCPITDEERRYIANDVLVVKEALEIMFEEGHDRLTIGSCCFHEFEAGYLKDDFEAMFPNLYEEEIDEGLFGAPTVGDYVKKSYHGGWCYVVPGKAKRPIGSGVTADVNSLYPSVMHSESGSVYPVGLPKFWKGDYIPDECLDPENYWFVRVRTRFYIRPGFLPTVQIKKNRNYRSTEWLESSDVLDPETGELSPFYMEGGVAKDAIVELTLTCTDFKLLKDHYYLSDFEVLDGCWFRRPQRHFRPIHRHVPGDEDALEGRQAREREAVPQQPLRKDGVFAGFELQGRLPRAGWVAEMARRGGSRQAPRLHRLRQRHHELRPQLHHPRGAEELPRPRRRRVLLRRHRLDPLRPGRGGAARRARAPHGVLLLEGREPLGLGVVLAPEDLHRARGAGRWRRPAVHG